MGPRIGLAGAEPGRARPMVKSMATLGTPGSVRRMGRRGLSMVTSAVVIVVVLALLGVGTYAVMGGFSAPGNPKTCAPANSPICGSFVNLHDVTLLLPFKSVQQGTSVPFTISLPAGESATSYSINFGDGQPATKSPNATIAHTFTTPGTFLVTADATVAGQTHDNLGGLVQVQVTPSFSSVNGASVPGVAGQILANSTEPTGGRGVSAVLQAGQYATFSGSYTSAPTNPAFLTAPPTFAVSGGVTPVTTLGNSSGTAKVTFATAGTYTVTFVGSAVSGNQTVFQNFTWTAIVTAAGVHAGIAGGLTKPSPHPGEIINYELVPGGGLSEDPAIDYETAGAEPIMNVYQTLITYNGSLTGPTANNFVPVLATCVPGSPQCVQLYGDSLADGWNYTFVIQPNASFYDPATQTSWGVWPSDVLFSMARTMGFSTLPCTECNNGWIITQALLNPGNVTWDSIHGSFNNTPQNILGSISLNNTTYCPQAALTQAHGCVTFRAYGHDRIWPYFLELVADPLGGSIVPCGWFSASAQGAGIPYWTQGNSSGSGDHPCGAPGSPGWGVAPSQMPYTGWDEWEQLGSGAFGTYAGHVQYAMLGSGPYYMQQYSVGISYTLQANPAYRPNPYCTWTGCQPASNNYARTVSVTWETQATPGEQAYAAGIADQATIPTTDIALLIQLINAGKVTAISAPTLTIGFEPFNMNFNIGGAQKYTSLPITVKSDWFSYVGMREFFSRAYPYQTVEQTISTRDGIQFGFDYGGAIPQFMANYYPRDIPWPSTDPCNDPTNVSCPTYWWAQMLNPSSPYYDPEAAQCTASNPCQIPMFGQTGNAAGDQVMALWASEISTLSGGAIKVGPLDINFVDIVVSSEFSGPGQNPLPIYTLGWAPDYPDPTDYVAPLYSANSTYTYGDAVMQQLIQPQFTQGCPANATDYNYFANTTFGNDCQGEAYKAMLHALDLAAVAPPGAYRVMLYDLAEKIAYQLTLYVYTGQANLVASVASWIDPSSINTNVTIGGGGDALYYELTGLGVQYAGST